MLIIVRPELPSYKTKWKMVINKLKGRSEGSATCSPCVRISKSYGYSEDFQDFKRDFQISTGILGLHKHFKILQNFRQKLNSL